MRQEDPESGATEMKWSFDIGEYFGISLRMHASFLLLLAWVAFATIGQTGSLLLALDRLLLVGMIFAIVVMHEYGHALAARHFGIGTREITLLPIGGVARLERMPEDPRQEMLVALAGPAVNVALALGIAVFMLMAGGHPGNLTETGLLGGPLLGILLRVNIIMAVFNMLPALPMDGGRVLRAALAMRMPALRATRIASGVARGIAGGMMLLGLYSGNLLLAVVGLFVCMASKAEYHQALWTEMRRQARGRPGEAFWTAFRNEDPPGEWIPGAPEAESPPDGRDGRPRARVTIHEVPTDGPAQAGGTIRVVRVEPEETP